MFFSGIPMINRPQTGGSPMTGTAARLVSEGPGRHGSRVAHLAPVVLDAVRQDLHLRKPMGKPWENGDKSMGISWKIHGLSMVYLWKM